MFESISLLFAKYRSFTSPREKPPYLQRKLDNIEMEVGHNLASNVEFKFNVSNTNYSASHIRGEKKHLKTV